MKVKWFVCVMWWEYDENMHTFFFRNYGNKGIKLCTKVLLRIWKMDKIYVKYRRCCYLSFPFKILLFNDLTKKYIFIPWKKSHMIES